MYLCSTIIFYVMDYLNILFLVFLSINLMETYADSSLRKDIILNITTDYDRRIPPPLNSNAPITDTIQLYIISIDEVQDTSMDLRMSLFLRQSWLDPRLSYAKRPGIDRIELETSMISNIWVPDLYFFNEKKADVHDITVPNKLMHIYPDGLVRYSMRISGYFSCNMILYKYPLDRQVCGLRIESYGYSNRMLVLNWEDIPVELKPDLAIPQFHLGQYNTFTPEQVYNNISYSGATLTMELRRKYGYHVIQVFVPSVLTIFLSWLSFWLDVDAVPARVSLGILTVLTVTTQSSGASATLPPVSYIKAIDVWMAMCLVFVFAAFIEYAYVNVLDRADYRNNLDQYFLRGTRRRSAYCETLDVSFSPEETKENKSKTVLSRARAVDKAARVIFPVAFLTFNLVFWIVYFVWEPEGLHSVNTVDSLQK